jgi:hypothetical protein
MNTDHTLEEVGQQFSVTRERIRQIEAKALSEVRSQKSVLLWPSDFRLLYSDFRTGPVVQVVRTRRS